MLAAALASLAACSGEVTLGNDGWLDSRPTVSVAASNTNVTQAGTITLVAAASDDSRVRDVAFYGLIDNASTLIARVDTEPYRIALDLDRADNGVRYYFARATDDNGNTADSALISITVAIP
ncbi:hypothetical protein BH09PSE6_BH09PSE6_25340 [soil metagenome]